jgi:hypothetical protein
LTDANGFISLTVQATNPSQWPQYFSVAVTANPNNTFNLSVLFTKSSAVLETFLNLSLTPADPNYAATRINSLSKFVMIPSTFAPSGSFPAGFVATVSLTNTGAVNIQDAGGATTYLTVQASGSAGWPPSFGVLTQGNLQKPDVFNLCLVYEPPSGGVGVAIPAIVEQFHGVSLDHLPEKVDSLLITATSFEHKPNLSLSAYDLMNYDASDAVPAIELAGAYEGANTTWKPVPDLLESGPTDPNFVVEREFDGTAHLRFGDDTNGQSPESGTVFTASYRIGNGTAGNVGAETVVNAAGVPGVESCTNPLPASGGVDPETADQIRRRAPQGFLTQERAVTLADYEAAAEKTPQVERAVASLRWTGSWHTVFLTAEPMGAGALTPQLKKAISKNLEQNRLCGQDIELQSPQYVPLQIDLTISIDPNYFQAQVQQSLLQVLGSQILPNGQKGLFYPDSFTFGQTVYLSPIYTAARKVAGVLSVTATVFQPQGAPTNQYLVNGAIPLGPFQIARLDNNPSLPDHGQLNLTLEGGK